VRIPTTEKGNRLVEAQELQENIFCASSVAERVCSSVTCLKINCNSTDEVLKKFPQTHALLSLVLDLMVGKREDGRREIK